MHIVIMIILFSIVALMLIPLLIELLKLVAMALVPAFIIMVAFIIWKKSGM
ncbi:MAG: hypothetical protein WCO89_00480 [Syntrophus sp. (in: bacteria)]